MIERQIGIGELGQKPESIEITAESLAQDNHSPQAEDALRRFNEARFSGNVTAFERCSDARLKSIGESISVGSVAAAGIPSERLASDRGIARWVVLTHIDGDSIIAGQMPNGCGGLAAKGDEASVDGTEIAPYVRDAIADDDALVQSIISAERIADASGKPVAAWTIDHLTDDIYPIAFFQKKGSSMTGISAIRGYDLTNYNAEKIYEEGIPTVEDADIPEEFRTILEQNRAAQTTILSRYPDFRAMQKVQNPRMVFFSTDIRSLRKFPTYSKIPGIAFKVFGTREKMGEDVRITDENLDIAFRQLWYAIHHSAEHFGDSTKTFSGTDRLVIETPDLNLTRKVWETASKKPWMQRWMELEGKRVILLQSNGGKVNAASEIVR